MKLDVKTLPSYTKKEEILNSITHLIGLAYALGLLIFFVIFNVTKGLTFSHMIPYYIYALSMAVVFGVSSAYHSSKFSSKSRAVLRMIDHSDIYFLIFGTYLPLCLYGIPNQPVMIAAIILQSLFLVAGVVLNIIPTNSKTVSIIAYIIYIIDGWLMLFLYPFKIGMDFNVFLWVLIGGVIYTIGAITYAIGKKRKYFHSLFHVFVVLGAVAQFIGIYLLLIQ